MANLATRNADDEEKYIKASGTGSVGDPHIIEHLETNSAGVLSTLGAVADAVATQGGTGSVSAKLRLVTSQLNTLVGHLDGVETLLTTLGGYLDGVETALALLATESGGNLAAAAVSLGVMDNWDSANRCKTDSPSDVISVTPTVSTSPAYTSGDAVGGKQTLTDAVRISGGKAQLDSLVVTDLSNQKPNLTVLFFDSDPSMATITDNAALAFGTDISKYIGKVNITTADFETIDSKAVASLGNLGKLLKATGSANLYAAVVTTSTPTLTGVADLTFKYGFLQHN